MRLIVALVLFFFCLTKAGFAQEADTLAGEADSTQEGTMVDSLFELAGVDSASLELTDEPANDNRIVRASDTSFIAHFRELEDLSVELNKLERLLRMRFDTVKIMQQVREIDQDLETVGYIYENFPEHLNYTALNAISVILERINDILSRDQRALLETYDEMLERRHNVLVLLQRATNYTEGRDSLLQEIFEEQLARLSTKWGTVMNQQRNRIKNLASYQNIITTRFIQVDNLQAQTENILSTYSERIQEAEYPPIWASTRSDYLFDSRPSFQQSFGPLMRIFSIFYLRKWGANLIVLGLILGFYFWVRSNLNYIKHRDGEEASQLSPLKYLSHRLWIPATLVGFLILPLLHTDSPAIYLNLIWMLTGILAYPLIRTQWPQRRKWIFDALFVLFLLSSLDEFLLFPSLEERWFLLATSLVSIVLAIFLYRNINQLTFSYPHLLRYATYAFIFFQVSAFLANILGIFTMAKTAVSTGLTSLMYAFVLTAFIKIVMEAMYLQGHRDDKGSRFTFWYKYQDIEKRLRRILLIIAVAAWIVVTLRNGTLFDSIVAGVTGFLEHERYLGDFAFTWGSLLTFFLVIWISSALAQVIKYFFGTTRDSFSSGVNNNLANYMLIIRLVILAAGFFLALSAAGIPLDKVAIVIGALGVGIGFGLQNIVNNLVSGIILAFERPIKIGDTVQFGTEMGKVKEIGIRASIITTFDGAEVIVPNGDLISSQITNWTMDDQNRRIEVIVGVGYGSDVEQVKATIQKALEEEKDVLSFPQPLILVQDLNSSSVDFRVLFWTGSVEKWLTLKSSVLGNIYKEIRNAGIEIPFPKRDITLNFPKNGEEAPGKLSPEKLIEIAEKETTPPTTSKTEAREKGEKTNDRPIEEPAEETSEEGN